ncbi:hypothetical protein B566_EDAN012276 [Ephemera danica]|nr:hypothetical protein B566_EDAN012276 [Ephemera danica]
MAKLKDSECEELFQEAWDIFSLYFKYSSPDFVGFPADIVRSMSSVLEAGEKNILSLRNTPPLFQAFDWAFTKLERELLPLFHHSEDFFLMLCGKRLSKLNRNRPRRPECLADSEQKFMLLMANYPMNFFHRNTAEYKSSQSLTKCSVDLNNLLDQFDPWHHFYTANIVKITFSPSKASNKKNRSLELSGDLSVRKVLHLASEFGRLAASSEQNVMPQASNITSSGTAHTAGGRGRKISCKAAELMTDLQAKHNKSVHVRYDWKHN